MTYSRLLLLISVLFVLALPAAAQARTIEGVPYVIDGDTLDIQGQRVRLFGINAPESKQACGNAGEQWSCGQAATEALRQIVGRQAVSCQVRDTDAYGRSVSTCVTRSGEDLSAAMVERGMANAYRRYSTAYVGLENQARADGVGVWSGDYVDPETYRHGGAVANRGSSGVLGALTGLFTGRTSSQAGVDMAGLLGSAEATDESFERVVNEEEDSPYDPRMVPSDNYREVGRRHQGVNGMSGAQFCALAELARRPCR
mgnify:CR=1 FL=1